MRKVLKKLGERRGVAPVHAAVAILVFTLVISYAFCLAYAEARTVSVRNAMSKALSTLALRISDDTYKALRESSFDEYGRILESSGEYRRELERIYKREVESVIPLEGTGYRVDGVSLSFDVTGKKITYTCRADVYVFPGVFGGGSYAMVRGVTVYGSHTAKYGR